MESTLSTHRKIELQSPEDLSYLIANVRRAADDAVNAAFPPVEGVAGQEDELRMRIEQLVNEYIKQTFTLAAPNLTINGLPVEPARFLSTDAADTSATNPRESEQYEPFDGRKRQRVEELAREEEDLLREIAALKRRVPSAAATAYADAFREATAADEALLGNIRRETLAKATQEAQLDGLELTTLERQSSVEKAFASAVGSLERLKKDMPATVAKMERARVAGEYVVTQR